MKCKNCKKEFSRPPQVSKKLWKKRKYCSKGCIQYGYLAKVPKDEVGDIKARHESGETYTQISEDYDVTPSTISNIVNDKSNCYK